MDLHRTVPFHLTATPCFLWWILAGFFYLHAPHTQGQSADFATGQLHLRFFTRNPAPPLTLSALALQRSDKTWLESRDWTSLIRAHEELSLATSDGIPAAEFEAIRFRVLPEDAPAEAVPQTVELPVRFAGGGPITVDIEVRPKPASAIPSFTVLRLHTDTFHRPFHRQATLPPGTTAYDLRITDRLPRPALPTDNPLTNEGVELGRRLFHDTRLSKAMTQSCASCHQATHGFAENLPTSTGAEGQTGRRNSMPLTNLAWAHDFFWDGRTATLREQVLMPISDKHEMNAPLELVVERLSADSSMAERFTKAFGTPGITTDRIARALEQHLLTLVAQDSKFDRALRKLDKLTPSEARGLQLFVTEFDPKLGLRGADCFHCHSGMLFTDFQHRNNGLRPNENDTGRREVTGQPGDDRKFKTPSLRNVALTPPYMHDGRFQTLEEVIEHYSTGVHRSSTLDPNLAKHPQEGIQLSAQDKSDLVAFLKTLTDFSIPSPTHSLTQTAP